MLNSKDKISGTNSDATFNTSCYSMIPFLGDKHKYQFAVESFVSNSTGPFLCFIPSLTQLDSFSTSTKTENQLVMMTTDNTYHKDLVHSSIGHTAHIDCLRTGIINIVLTDLSGNPVNINNWVMTIVLWQVDE